MARGNSLGAIVEPSNTTKQTIKNAQANTDVMVNVNEKALDKIRANRSAIICCFLTTLLVGLGVGISVWYAIVEIS